MMKFDSNLAWQDAHGAVRANREVMAVLAGVFIFLPALAVTLLYPFPQAPAGITPEKLYELVRAWFSESKWLLLGTVLAYDLGSLAVLSLLRDHSRPTVGQAIMAGLGGLIPLILARLLVFMVLSLVFVLIAGLFGAAGSVPLATAGVALFVVLLIYVVVRTCLVAPLIAKEGLRTPYLALRRSWQLTKGNTGSILLFFALVWIAFQVVSIIAAMLIDLVLGQLAGAGTAEFASAAIGSLMSAGFSLYITAMLGATHRQLASPPQGNIPIT